MYQTSIISDLFSRGDGNQEKKMSLLRSSPASFFNLIHSRPLYSENPNSFNLQHFFNRRPKLSLRLSASSVPPNPEQNPKSNLSPSPRRRGRPPKPKDSPEPPDDAKVGLRDGLPTMIPRKPRRGRRSEAAAVEDYVRDKLEQVFASIRESNTEVLERKGEVLKDREQVAEEEERVHVVEEEDLKWPLDADVGWGVRASEYFEKHPIKNVVVDGVVIDWEGELDEGWVQEVTCLEWESFAFHPSPLIVLVFERYNRAADNWKLLKELEKAAKVYWSAKDRLPPRTIKIDMNIETDLAYALKVKECPQLLFLKGNRIVYREKEMRTADELVHMIAHFYYNAKRPVCVDPAAVAPLF